MKKETRKYLIIIVAVIVVLGAAIAVLTLTDGTKTTPGSASSHVSSSKIVLSDYVETDVASVEVTRKNDDHSFKILMAPDESGKVIYSIADVPDNITFSTAKMRVVAKDGFQLSATQELGETDNLAEYGLDDPLLTLRTVLNDGSSFAFLIGNESPSGGNYLMEEGSNTLYTVSLNANTYKNLLELVDTAIVTVGDPNLIATGQASNYYSYISIGGKSYEEPITIDDKAENSYSAYRMTSPARFADASCNDYLLSQLTATFDKVTAKSVAVISPTAAEVKQYGLDDPDTVIHFIANPDDEAYFSEHTIKIGNITEDYLYPVMADDVPVIYLVEQDTVSLWIDQDPFSYRSSLVFLPNIVDVENVIVKTADETHSFTLSREETEKSTAENPVYDYSVTGTDGQDLTYSTFQKFYQNVISVQLLEESREELSGTPYMTFTFRYYEGGADMIAFYPCEDNDRQCLIALNGNVCGTTKMTTLTAVLNSANDMEEDKNFTLAQ